VVLQAGDCAESFGDATLSHTAAKVALLDRLAAALHRQTGRGVVRLGRIAGQYAKPRSQAVETVGGTQIPVFRGHMINSAKPDAAARQHDPRRMLWALHAGGEVMRALAAHRAGDPAGPWSSHEALVIDYESALVRTGPSGRPFLGSTHLPWVGERTRQLDHAHVRLLAAVRNPVACKLGPGTDPATVTELCAVLDPEREPGRLALIVRMGRAIDGVLPAVVRAVRDAGHPVVWLSDPMHANTVRAASGHKTRHLTDMVAEVRAFRRVLAEQRAHAGGLHLEVATADVTECVGGPVPDDRALHLRYTSLCDPRLNPAQALQLIDRGFG
jgi:3-deoxy-7-phosphoheptulonate synthase